MIDFFALYTLKGLSLKLLKETKSLKITISGLNCDGKMDWKVIRGLRQIFNWTHQHLEVETVVIENRFHEFNGHNLDNFLDQEASDVLNYFKEYQELIHQMIKSPQLIVLDQGIFCTTSIFDFALAADVRVAHENIKYENDLRENCLIPTNALSTLGAHMFGKAMIKSMYFNPINHNMNQKIKDASVDHFYSSDEEKDQKLKTILMDNLRYSAVSRIQTKSLFQQEIENQLNYSFQKNLEYLNASLISGEFFSKIQGAFERANPREINPYTIREEKSSHLRSV